MDLRFSKQMKHSSFIFFRRTKMDKWLAVFKNKEIMTCVAPYMSTEDCFVLVTSLCKTVRHTCFQLSHAEHEAVARYYFSVTGVDPESEAFEEMKRKRWNLEEQWNTIYAWYPRIFNRFHFMMLDFDETFARTFLDEHLKHGCTYPPDGGTALCLGGCGKQYAAARFVKRKYCVYNCCGECFNTRFGRRKGVFSPWEAFKIAGELFTQGVYDAYLGMRVELAPGEFDFLFRAFPPDEHIGNEYANQMDAFNGDVEDTALIPGAEYNCFACDPEEIDLDQPVVLHFVFFPIAYIRKHVNAAVAARIAFISEKRRESEWEASAKRARLVEGVSTECPYFERYCRQQEMRKRLAPVVMHIRRTEDDGDGDGDDAGEH